MAWHHRRHSACHSRPSPLPLAPSENIDVSSLCLSVLLAAAAHNEILNPIVGTEKKRPVTMPEALARHQRVPLSTAAQADKGHSTLPTVS